MCFYKYLYISYVAEWGTEPPLTYVIPSQEVLLGLTNFEWLLPGQISWQSEHSGLHYCPKRAHDTYLPSLKLSCRFRKSEQMHMFTEWANMFLGDPEPKLEKNQLFAELNKGRGHDHEIWGDLLLR